MSIDIEGTWYNQHGSRLELHADDEGHVDGWFHSGVGFDRPDERHRVEGCVRGDLISFHVDFGPHGTITAWTGHVGLDRGEPAIHTLWHMAVRGARSTGTTQWRGTWAGADTFHRQPAEAASARRPSHPVFDPPA